MTKQDFGLGFYLIRFQNLNPHLPSVSCDAKPNITSSTLEQKGGYDNDIIGNQSQISLSLKKPFFLYYRRRRGLLFKDPAFHQLHMVRSYLS
ncbi:hypothetical protein L2E82_15825 [Cichorium intybus]|uniref:Uncharacterized protein n=1 Tax=Cichorium intybus TaxID=13427 RepID=A0ACB9F4C0_CICIN|nr:hypothetical protein L2E82_15825 [Cichorium intybus]